MMKKIKTFKTFESNYIHDLFKDSHSALDLSKLIPIKKVINKKGHPTQQDINDIIDFVNLDPNFIYYDPNNSLYPYIYWKDFIYLEFFGTLSLEAAKMMMLDKRLNYQQNKFDEFLSKKDYDTAFQLADKRIVIPLYIKLFNDIPDNQKYEVFIYLYMRSEFGFEQFSSDFLDKVFATRFLSPDWKKRMNKLHKIIKPDENGYIMAYRGEGVAEDVLSWTLDKKIAKFFANRFGNNGRVIYDKVKVDNIMDYLTDRSESELLVKNPN